MGDFVKDPVCGYRTISNATLEIEKEIAYAKGLSEAKAKIICETCLKLNNCHLLNELLKIDGFNYITSKFGCNRHEEN